MRNSGAAPGRGSERFRRNCRGCSALRCSHGGPCGHPAKDTGKDARQCTPPSPSVTPPLAGEALRTAASPKGSPGRGAVGECRLRGAAPYRVFTLAGWLAFAASAGDDLRLLHRRCAGDLRNAACGRQCPHRPANLSACAMLPGGRNRPPYNARQTAGETGNFAFAADVSFPGTHLRGIVGRAFTPAARTSARRPASERAKRTDHQNSELLIPDPDPYHTQILSEMYKPLRQRKEPCHARCGQLAGL